MALLPLAINLISRIAKNNGARKIVQKIGKGEDPIPAILETADEKIQDWERGIFDKGSTPSETVEQAIAQSPNNPNAQYDTAANEKAIKNALAKIEKMRALESEERKELWAREDAIRKETQDREDTSWQREIADLRAAGVNPNLINLSANGAGAGGGITSATIEDKSKSNMSVQELKDLTAQTLEQMFSSDQNTRDRAMETLKAIVDLIPTSF